jgi:hypothetical protein
MNRIILFLLIVLFSAVQAEAQRTGFFFSTVKQDAVDGKILRNDTPLILTTDDGTILYQTSSVTPNLLQLDNGTLITLDNGTTLLITSTFPTTAGEKPTFAYEDFAETNIVFQYEKENLEIKNAH